MKKEFLKSVLEKAHKQSQDKCGGNESKAVYEAGFMDGVLLFTDSIHQHELRDPRVTEYKAPCVVSAHYKEDGKLSMLQGDSFERRNIGYHGIAPKVGSFLHNATGEEMPTRPVIWVFRDPYDADKFIEWVNDTYEGTKIKTKRVGGFRLSGRLHRGHSNWLPATHGLRLRRLRPLTTKTTHHHERDKIQRGMVPLQ